MRNLNPQETLAELSKNRLTLLDVRQPEELALARLPQALHIPMPEIPARLGELNREGAIAILCHHGSRSLQVARFLERNGFTDVINVAGGIAAWSEMDPSVPQY